MLQRALQPIFDAVQPLAQKVAFLESKLEAKSYSEFESLRTPTLDRDYDSRPRTVHRPNRQSVGSSRSLDSQDVVKVVKSSFRLDKPKFEFPSDLKEDGAFDDAVLKFIDECDRHIEMWLNLPENKDKEFEGSDVFALVTLPATVQKRCAHNLDLIFHKSEVIGWSLKQIQNAKYWDQATTEEVKSEILTRRAQGVAKKDAVKSIQPPVIAWTPGVGLIHLDAFEAYKSKLTTQVSRLVQGGVSLSFITMKDAIISAIPDRDFKVELYTQFGHSGSLPGPDASGRTEEYSMKDIFDFIRQYIVVIKQKGLAPVVNKNSFVGRQFTNSSAPFQTPLTPRRFGNHGKVVHAIGLGSEFPESDHSFWHSGHHQGLLENEDDEYNSVNQAVQGAMSKDCRHTGTGPDGKLLCPYLGNPESAKCGFRHPSKDLELKGKGVSKSVPAKPLKVHSAEGLGISYADDSEFQEEDGAVDS
jgi:hypothetical protein